MSFLMKRAAQSNKGNKPWKKRILSLVLAGSIGVGTVFGLASGVEDPIVSQAKQKDPMLHLADAKTIAISHNDTIDGLEIQIMSKMAANNSAIQALRLKEKNMASFRWSPLLNLKFPTKPNEQEAFEFQFKPMQLQYQVRILEHKINDEKLSTYEKVSNTYIDIITSQQGAKYDGDRLVKLQEALEKLKAKQVEGTATQSDVTKAETKVENLTTTVTNHQSKFERSKQKLGDTIGMDVTTGYRFEDAFVTANLSRSYIPLLQKRALELDQGVYEAEIAEEEALLALRVNYTLMQRKYGGYMNIINSHVQQALTGEKINKKAFKKDYDTFIEKIDEKWKGHYKILFIKIPKEWLKGDLDGVRYIEDDPQVLYTAALDYESARKECENTKKELKDAIADAYDGYAEARKAYVTLNKQVVKGERTLAIDQVKNILGELSDDEFQTEEQELSDMKNELTSALSTYSTTLYSFDRLCCGAVSQYLKGGGSAEEREESLSSIIQRGITYSIRPIVDSEEFLLTLNIPDDFEAKTDMHITHFALYSDGRRIGEKTPITEGIRHLTLTTKDVGRVTVRLYNGETFLDEPEIDPRVYIGDLKVTVGYQDEETKHKVGNYIITDDLSTDMITITLDMDQEQVMNEYVNGNEAAYYNITTDTGAYLVSDAKIPIGDSISYLAFVKGDIPSLMLHLYDTKGDVIGEAIFKNTKKELVHDVDEKEWTAIREAKEAKKIEEKKKEEEQAKEDAEKARRDRAIAVLQRLGYETTEENIAYALDHLRELEYAADLKEQTASMDKSYAKAQEALEKAKASGDATENELKELERRMKTIKETQKVQQTTFNNNATVKGLK